MEGNKRWLLYGDEVGIEDIEESSSQEFYEELPCQEASPRIYFDLMSLVKCVFCGDVSNKLHTLKYISMTCEIFLFFSGAQECSGISLLWRNLLLGVPCSTLAAPMLHL